LSMIRDLMSVSTSLLAGSLGHIRVQSGGESNA
jgi:hypothetical protein